MLGLAGIVGWALLRGLGDPGAAGRWDPEARLGRSGRLAVAVLTGFGLGGMSATFAGWATGLALVAALAGAAAVAFSAIALRPEPERGE